MRLQRLVASADRALETAGVSIVPWQSTGRGGGHISPVRCPTARYRPVWITYTAKCVSIEKHNSNEQCRNISSQTSVTRYFGETSPTSPGDALNILWYNFDIVI